MKNEMEIIEMIRQMDQPAGSFMKGYFDLVTSPSTRGNIFQFISLLSSTDQKSISAVRVLFEKIAEEE